MKKSVVIPWAKYQKLIGQEKEEEPPSMYDEEKIITTIPPRMKARAKALLGLLPDTNISWNQRGELLIDKRCIEGTNICDLIKSVLWSYKNYSPKGYDDFVKALASNNVPETLIQNTACRSDVKEMKCTDKCWVNY